MNKIKNKKKKINERGYRRNQYEFWIVEGKKCLQPKVFGKKGFLFGIRGYLSVEEAESQKEILEAIYKCKFKIIRVPKW